MILYFKQNWKQEPSYFFKGNTCFLCVLKPLFCIGVHHFLFAFTKCQTTQPIAVPRQALQHLSEPRSLRQYADFGGRTPNRRVLEYGYLNVLAIYIVHN